MRKAALTYIGAAVLFVAVEFSLFRTSIYRSLLEPSSSAGQVELLLAAARAETGAPDKTVLVVGDSRVGEGFSAKIANQAASGGLRFVNAAASGSTPRSWFYLLRELDPDAARYGTIVLALDDYKDEDGTWSWADYPLDLRIAIACLRLSDTFGFAFSFHQAALRWEAFRGALFKGFVYKDDLQAFLANPAARLRKVELYRRNSAVWNYDYEGNPASLAGLAIDWKARALRFPPGLNEATKSELTAAYFRAAAPQQGGKYRYRKDWLGKILERYRGRPTRIVFVRMPRTPLPLPDAPPGLSCAACELASANPAATALDEHAFDSLERPEYFFDTLHMNSDGRRLFSLQLAPAILSVRPR
jgi:hypothetical protein